MTVRVAALIIGRILRVFLAAPIRADVVPDVRAFASHEERIPGLD